MEPSTEYSSVDNNSHRCVHTSCHAGGVDTLSDRCGYPGRVSGRCGTRYSSIIQDNVIDDLYDAQGETGCLASGDVLLENITDMNVRIEELDRLLDQLSKDHKAGKVPATRYSILSSSYEKQRTAMKETVRKFETLAANNSDDCNADEFLEFLLQYRHDDPIDYDGLCRFLKQIIVHERKERYSRKCAHHIEVIFK